MAGDARAVRIRRGPDGGTSVADTASAVVPSVASRPHPNAAGGARALRMFLFFLVGLAVIYAFFLGYAVTSLSRASNGSVEAVLTISVVVALGVGWWVTLGQAPTLAYVEGAQLVVRERTGRNRRFRTDELRIHLLRTNPASLLSPEPTEFVELSVPRGSRRTYLVGSHFFDFAH